MLLWCTGVDSKLFTESTGSAVRCSTPSSFFNPRNDLKISSFFSGTMSSFTLNSTICSTTEVPRLAFSDDDGVSPVAMAFWIGDILPAFLFFSTWTDWNAAATAHLPLVLSTQSLTMDPCSFFTSLPEREKKTSILCCCTQLQHEAKMVQQDGCKRRTGWNNKMGATVQQEDKDGAEVEHKMVVNWASKPRIAMWECNYYCIFISCKTMEQKTISASSELLKLVTTSQLFLLLLLLLRLDCRYERQMKTHKEAWSKQQL